MECFNGASRVRQVSPERLINEVYRRPPLWDIVSSHVTKATQDQLWEDVAIECSTSTQKFSGPEVRAKWKNLKDTYRKELKKVPTLEDGSIDMEYKPSWPYFGHMAFIKEQILSRMGKLVNPRVLEDPIKLPTNLTDEVSITKSDCDYSYWKEEAPEPKRPKLNDSSYDNGQIDKEGDEDFHFFMSILPHVKSLNPIQKLRFRSQIQNLLIYEEMANAISANGCAES